MGAAISSPRSSGVVFRGQRLPAAQQPEQEDDRLGGLQRLVGAGRKDGKEDADGRPAALAGRAVVEQAANLTAVVIRGVFVPSVGKRAGEPGQIVQRLQQPLIPGVRLLRAEPPVETEDGAVPIISVAVTFDNDIPGGTSSGGVLISNPAVLLRRAFPASWHRGARLPALQVLRVTGETGRTAVLLAVLLIVCLRGQNGGAARRAWLASRRGPPPGARGARARLWRRRRGRH